MNRARNKREINPISKDHVDIAVKGLEKDLICGSPLSGRANGKARFTIFHLLYLSYFSFSFFFLFEFTMFHKYWRLANSIIIVSTNRGRSRTTYLLDAKNIFFVVWIFHFSFEIKFNYFFSSFFPFFFNKYTACEILFQVLNGLYRFYLRIAR